MGRRQRTTPNTSNQSNNGTMPFRRYAQNILNNEEINAELSERFGKTNIRERSNMPNQSSHSPTPFYPTNDVCNYFKDASRPATGLSWLTKPEIPSKVEILHEQTQCHFSGAEPLIEVSEGIQPYRAEGPYESVEEYLRTKYELLREDALRPFREVLAEVRADPHRDEDEYENPSIGIYDPVYISSLIFSGRGLATRVTFSLGRVKKLIHWEQSKRLITGTLVALSPVDDGFRKICVLAIVAARPLEGLRYNPPQIDLFFARPDEQEIDPMRKWMMVECRTSFYEGSRYTLLALQHMMKEPFPMASHLVKIQKEIDPPEYIKRNPYLDLGSLVSIEDSVNYEKCNILEDWPSAEALSLDRSQSKAIRRMLSKRLAIIQGPPGTGKTFSSIIGIKIMLNNMRQDDPPIIITAQTNHAVDQLLKHIMEFESQIVRLGGRSKDEDIKKRTLFEIRSSMPPNTQPRGKNPGIHTAWKKLTNEVLVHLAPMKVGQPPLDHRLLLKLGLISQEQADSLHIASKYTMGVALEDSPEVFMEQWLGKNLLPCDSPTQPENINWDCEEEDFEMEQLKELEAEAVSREEVDIETLAGEVITLSDNFKGKGGSMLSSVEVQELLATSPDLYSVPARDRGAIYNYWKREAKKLLTAKIRGFAKSYSQIVLERKICLWEGNVGILQRQRVIGCTTTGLSKYRAMLAAVKPRVVLVEEAAETMEAPVTAACLPSLEHLILIGDHQQLRPHCQVHEFEDDPWYLNLSAFERLLQNDIKFDTLTRQRRMIPEVRRLLHPIYGSTLKDHESVLLASNRPPVEGMGGNNSFLFCHKWPEARDANMSTYNDVEANFIVGFVDYLVFNGVEPAKITILTFYNGQRKALKKKIYEHPNLRTSLNHFQVVTVDSYQGEENDIVLLSLVRSNNRHAIGFLADENRACVALSRAKRGFYLFGNAELLACESHIWASIVDIMYGDKRTKVTSGQSRRVGFLLPLECTRHGRKVWVETPDDWDCILGGCDIKCEGSLPCGHKCPYTCHPFPDERVNCMQRCTRRVDACGHQCTAICCNSCSCQICDRRSNGQKSIMRPLPANSCTFTAPAQRSQSMMIDPHLEPTAMPASLAAHENASELSLSVCTLKVAETRGDGLHRAYPGQKNETPLFGKDSNAHHEVDSNHAPFSSELVELPPEKKDRSDSVGVLIDIDCELELLSQDRGRSGGLSYAGAVSRKEESTSFNLLD